MSKHMERLVRDEASATVVEYGLIAALIALAIIAGATTLGFGISDQLSMVAERLASRG